MLLELDSINRILAFASVTLCAASGGAILLFRDFRSFPFRFFAIGMIALAFENLFNLFCQEAVLPNDAVMWQKWALSAGAFFPGCWLFFSFSYARLNYVEFIKRWKWLLGFFVAAPFLLVFLYRAELLASPAVYRYYDDWVFPLAWPGLVLHILFLLSSAQALTNLEKTLRTSHGGIRWQIKFFILGIGSIFAGRIYVATQVLLFWKINTQSFAIDDAIIIVSNILIIFSAVRMRLRNANIYVSQELLYSSITVLAVASYLLIVGVFAKVATYLHIGDIVFQSVFIFFLALLGLTALLLSTHIRYLIKRFVQRHFRRPVYDYRKIWTIFSHETASLTDIRELCTAITRTVSETFTASAATIWLIDDDSRQYVLGGSTELSLDRAIDSDSERELALLMEYMIYQKEPVDFISNIEESSGISERFLKEFKIRFSSRLLTGGEFVGIMTLNEKTGQPFSLEDLDLLKMLSDQAAVLILNNKLFESLGRAKEMHAFQTLSAFFIHDLKNVASTLSLTIQNLPIHYDKPEFRKDALKLISKSREKIQNMCSQLALINQKFELKRRECNLNEIVDSTLAALNLTSELEADLQPVPAAWLDPEQIQKVVLNLILNANESRADQCRIRIETLVQGENIIFSVSDNGCGMSRDFIRQDLFRPFKTTKNSGSGIGLYQSKMIVEAHGGRVEVNSQEGSGSTFRIFLPLNSEDPDFENT